MKYILPVDFRGSKEEFAVEYGICTNVHETGFDALLDFPLDKINCIGYPTVHGYFPNMKAMGYRRTCAIIQLIERIEIQEDGKENTNLSIDSRDCSMENCNPYFAYGYPVEIFDAPCWNLGDCNILKWKAYTYLVDMPSRMNNNKIKFLAGFSWGYIEDKNGPQEIFPFEVLEKKLFEQQIETVSSLYISIKW
ncbi:MAG: hypothetical protein ACOX8M_08930 [Marvinbryantia sp.]|jgi:hypothetical protein